MENTNTDVGASAGEPIVKTGSSSEPVNFDEMEAIMSSKPKSKVDEKLGAEGASKKSKKADTDDEPDPKSKRAEGKKSKETDDESDDDTDLDDDAKAKAQQDAAKVKAIKVKNGDAEVELRMDTKIPVKIGGKDELVDLQTLRNEFSGKTDWSRKYQALDTERKSFESERRDLQSSVDDLFDLAVTQKKPMEAVAYLTDLLGGDGLKTVQELQQQMLQQYEELSKLTPEEKRARQAEERANLIEAKAKNKETAQAKRTEQESIAKRVDDVKAKYKITDERFQDIYHTLKKNGVKAEELTPEFVGDVHERWLQMDQVDEVVEELSLTENALEVKKALLTEWAKDRSLTKEDIVEIARQVFASNKKASGSKLKQKMERSGVNNSNTNTAKRNNQYEPVTFDDL